MKPHGALYHRVTDDPEQADAVLTGSGRLAVDSVCVHGDSADAVAQAHEVRRPLEDASYVLAPFVP